MSFLGCNCLIWLTRLALTLSLTRKSFSLWSASLCRLIDCNEIWRIHKHCWDLSGSRKNSELGIGCISRTARNKIRESKRGEKRRESSQMSWQEFMLPSFPTRASVNFPAVWISKLDEGWGWGGGMEGICRTKFGTEVSGHFCERPRRMSHGGRHRFCNLWPWLSSSASFLPKGASSLLLYRGQISRVWISVATLLGQLKNSTSQRYLWTWPRRPPPLGCREFTEDTFGYRNDREEIIARKSVKKIQKGFLKIAWSVMSEWIREQEGVAVRHFLMRQLTSLDYAAVITLSETEQFWCGVIGYVKCLC